MQMSRWLCADRWHKKEKLAFKVQVIFKTRKHDAASFWIELNLYTQDKENDG